MMPPSNILAHMVAFYPDETMSLHIAEALVAGGAWALELQFPFSDPSADGPAIQTACFAALKAGFTVDKGFALLAEIRSRVAVPIFIMTYANLLVRRGIEAFVKDARVAGASGLIIPDLVRDADDGLYQACEAEGITSIPVAVVGMNPKRIQHYSQLPYLYVSLRKGITGLRTRIDAQVLHFLRLVRPLCHHLMGGFGIRTAAQLAEISPHVHSVAIGSALVNTIQAAQSSGQSIPTQLLHFLRELQQET